MSSTAPLTYDQAGVNYDLIDPLKISAQRAAGRLDLHGRFSPFVTQILAEDASGETWNARSASRFHVVAICSARAKWQE